MIIFLKNFLRIRIALLRIFRALLLYLAFLYPLRFRRDCKGRNFILKPQILFEVFFFLFSLIAQFKQSLTPISSLLPALPPLRSGAKIEKNNYYFQALTKLIF